MGMVYTGSGEMGGYEYVPDDVPNQGALSGALPAAQTTNQNVPSPLGKFFNQAPSLSDFSQALTGSSQTSSADQPPLPADYFHGRVVKEPPPPQFDVNAPPAPVPLTPPPEVPPPPQAPNIDYGGFSAKDIQNFLDYNYGVGVDPVLNQRISDQMKERGIERYSPEQIQFAVDSLNRWNAVGDIRQQQGMARGNPWEDPNWRTIEALKRAAQEKERVQVANTPSPYTVGPGPAATPQNLTLDPMYAQLIGSADPKAVLRAINAGTLKPGALPADIAAKLFPSGGAFPSETKKDGLSAMPEPLASALSNLKQYGYRDASSFSDKEVEDWTKWYASQPPEKSFLAGAESPYKTNAEALKNMSADQIDKMARDALQRSTLQRVYGLSPADVAPWTNPNWRAVQAQKEATIAANDAANRAWLAAHPNSSALGGSEPSAVKTPAAAGTTSAAAVTGAPAATPAAGTTAPAATTTPTQIDLTIKPSGTFITDAANGKQYDIGLTYGLAKQVLQNFDVKNSTGGAYATKGDPIGFNADQIKQVIGSDPTAGQMVMFDISKHLQKAGVTDLNQIGVRTVTSEEYQGGPDQPPTIHERKEFYNKDTGERINGSGTGYLGETYTGKGVTTYFLTEKPDGTIGVKTEGQDTSDAGMIMPVLAAASMFFLPGITSSLSSALSGTFGSASNIVASGLVNGVTSGVIAELGGGNFGDGFLKGAVGGAAGTAAGTALNTYLPTDMNATIRTGLVNAGTSAARAIASGGNVETAIANGLMSGAVSGALSTAGRATGMDAQTAAATARVLAPIVLSLAKTGGISEQTIINAVMSAGSTLIGNIKPGTAKETPPGKKAGGAISTDDLEFDAYAKAKRLGADDEEAMSLLRPAKRYQGGGDVWGEDGSDGTFYFDGGDYDYQFQAPEIRFDEPISVEDSQRMDEIRFDNQATTLANLKDPEANAEEFAMDKDAASKFIAQGGDPLDVAGFNAFLREQEGPQGEGESLGRVEISGKRDDQLMQDIWDAINREGMFEGDVQSVTESGTSTDLPSPLTTETEPDENRRLDCAEGFHEENGLCVPDDDKKESTECPEGYLYNATSKQCEKIDTTKPGPTTTPPKTGTTTAAGKAGSSSLSINTPAVTQPSWLNLQALRSEGGGDRFQDPLERVMALAGKPTMATPSQGGLDPYLQQILAQRTERPFYRYGQEPSIDAMLNPQRQYADGGYVAPLMAMGGMALPLLAKQGGLTQYGGREDFKDGKHVAGDGDGQSDDIPAWLADGEFVFPADVVSALGNGSTKAGTDKLYEMMHNIRSHARSSGPKDLPPPAKKSPLDYLSKKK